MGEYANFQGHEIKIGTCENMYYLRASQARFVRALEGNVDPVADRHGIRFRFPFPDEDRVLPGAFEEYDRRIVVGVRARTDSVDHAATCKGGNVTIVQQRWVASTLVLICGCSGCDARYRVPSLEDAAEVIAGCRSFADLAERAQDENTARFWHRVADRIEAGYAGRTEADRCTKHEDCGDHHELGAACLRGQKAKKAVRRSRTMKKSASANAQIDYASFLGLDGKSDS